MQFSIADYFSPPVASVVLAQGCERAGFAGYWVGEHHTAYQCPDPLLLMAVLAGVTENIRVGTLGLLMGRRRAYDVAQSSRILSQLYGDRFELGMVVGRGTMPSYWDAGLESRRVVELLAQAGVPSDEENAPLVLAAVEHTARQWILGQSDAAAELAGALGTGYCASFHHGGTVESVGRALATYRDRFRPSRFLEAPRAGFLVSGHLAIEDRVSALQDARSGFAFERKVEVSGTPSQTAEKLKAICSAVPAEEVLFLNLDLPSADSAGRALSELGRALGLIPRAAARDC